MYKYSLHVSALMEIFLFILLNELFCKSLYVFTKFISEDDIVRPMLLYEWQVMFTEHRACRLPIACAVVELIAYISSG